MAVMVITSLGAFVTHFTQIVLTNKVCPL